MGSTIHVIGSMMVDRVSRVRALPRAGETVVALSSAVFAGGKGANQAAAAAKCGARVRMLGRTGADGAFIVDALRAAGVEVGSVSTADRVSGVASVTVAESGENAIVIAPESNTRLVLPEIEAFLASAVQGDLVLFQNECSCLHEGIAHASSRALRVWLNAAPADPSLRSLRFEKLTGLVVNETEAEALTGEPDPRRALELLAGRMPGGTVIVTLGALGAIVAHGKSRFAHRGFSVDAVDAVGCGDAFVGAYLAAISTGRDIQQALARANAAGALAAMREGAMRSLPARGEVDVTSALPEGTRLAPRPSVAVDAATQPSVCGGCGYDLKGKAVGERCPECGREVTLVVTPSGGLRREDLEQVARGARWMMAGAALLAGLPLVSMLVGTTGSRAFAVVCMLVYAIGAAATLGWGTWMTAVRGVAPSDAWRLRLVAAVRAATVVLGQALLPALALVWQPVQALVQPILGTRFMSELVSGWHPLLVLGADVALVWILRDVSHAMGSGAGARWRAAAAKARVGILLVLPMAILLGGGLGLSGGFVLVYLVWGGSIALAAKEMLESARAGLRRS